MRKINYYKNEQFIQYKKLKIQIFKFIYELLMLLLFNLIDFLFIKRFLQFILIIL